MPRDSNGNYTLPAGNPVVTGEVISTGWANPTMSDIGAELTNSLDRQGRGGMLAPFKFVDGTNSQPGMTWTNEPTTGFYRAGGADMRATVAGVGRMRWTGTGCDVYNAVAGTWVALANSSGVNFAVLNQVNIFTQSQTFGGTYAPSATIDSQADSFGVGLKVRGRVTDNVGTIAFNSSDGVEDYAYIGSLVPDSFSVFTNAFTERFRIDGTGAAKFIPNGTTIAEINASGLEVLAGSRVTVYNADNSKGLQIVSIGVDAYLAGTVDSVQFQIAAANRFGVNASGISTYAGGQTRFYSADNSRFGAIYNSNGVLIFDTLQPMGTDAMKFQMGGVDWFTMTGSVANFYNGMPLRLYQADNSFFGEIKTTSGILSFNAAALGFDVSGARYLDMSDGGINVYEGRQVRYYGPGNAGTLTISKPASAYSVINELSGVPLIFEIGSVEQARIVSTGITLYNSKQIAMFNADNSAFKALLLGAANDIVVDARGGVWHWNSSALPAGTVVFSTTDPAGTGVAGNVVLVYE